MREAKTILQWVTLHFPNFDSSSGSMGNATGEGRRFSLAAKSEANGSIVS